MNLSFFFCYFLSRLLYATCAESVPNTTATIQVCCPTRNLTYSEQWGYVNVRPNAYTFYWLYYEENSNNQDTKRPWFIWLQGGPGCTSTGYGNFEELGPLDANLKVRNTTWLSRGDLLFVDSPVGTGFSYVTDDNAYARDVQQIAIDLTQFLIGFLSTHEGYKARPCYIVGESYGGKVAPVFARYLHQAIQAGNVSMNLRGAGICAGWVSPMDFLETWPDYLHYLSRLGTNETAVLKTIVQECKRLVQNERWTNASDCWIDVAGFITINSHFASWYNILKQIGDDSWSRSRPEKRRVNPMLRDYEERAGGLSALMNGRIRKKLGSVVPKNVTFEEQSDNVFVAQWTEFMKPVIDSVDYLLNLTNLAVFVFNGQLDLICNAAGMQRWVNKLQWPHLSDFQQSDREKILDKYGNKELAAFVKNYKNFYVYWMLKAGHAVPADAPTASLTMLDVILSIGS